MQNKAPQGKQDPMPTPESELEQYGVWVKAEPQDVVDEPGKRLSTTMTKSSGSENPVMSSDEEAMVDSFSFDESMSDGLEELEALSPVDDLEIIGELPEEMEPFDLEDIEQAELEPLPSDFAEDAPEDTALDITLDELDYEEPTDDIESASSGVEKELEDSFATTDVDIEDFNFSDTDSAATLPSLDDFETSPQENNREALASVDDIVPDDFESLDIDLQFDDTIPADDTVDSSEAYMPAEDLSIDVTSDFESVDLDSIGEQPVLADETPPVHEPVMDKPEAVRPESTSISMDSFIDLDDSEVPGIIPDMELENVSLNDEPIGFDDVQAVSDDLGSRVTEPSSDLLQKIVLELSSIKEELVSLRGQLSSLKSANHEEPLVEEQELVEEAAPGGFFDEEDDDTIALTGDELDNILNTADFTEEVADNEPFEEPATVSLEIPDDIELLPEDGIYDTQESGIETIELPVITPTNDEFQSISALDGVTPITNLPEDTSFLDAPEDEMNLELEMPLEDVPLVEPDSSDLESIIDSAFDIEDTEFDNPEIEGEEVESEIVLDFDTDDEPVISTVDSFPEPLDELEDALELEEFVESEDLGGLELLAEETELEELEELSLDEDILDSLTEEPVLATSPSEELNESPSNQAVSDLMVEMPSSIDDFEEMETYLEPEPLPLEPDTLEMPTEIELETPSYTMDATPLNETTTTDSDKLVPDKLKHDVKSVLLYLDQLLASLPEEKIEEFASSEYYDTYKRLFDDLGLL